MRVWNGLIGALLTMGPALAGEVTTDPGPAQNTAAPPRIVNIINFIRGVEPRSDVDLLEPVRQQIRLVHQYKLPATFLVQYDALTQERFVNLLRSELSDRDEVGAWLEVVQPQVEAAGLKWRGRFPWDWHTDVGFTVGYTPAEREHLMDVYISAFEKAFEKRPKSVGCWLLDAPTLAYLADKYGVSAACICKDQTGTDGYTLWGGYWNQAYYPSRKNGFMPAQTPSEQIPVPVFRMLGSDPIYQYDTELGEAAQGVVTLEPVYTGSAGGGGRPEWVRWFFDMLTGSPCLAFAYTQVGQENSFGWPAMEKGLVDQVRLVAELAGAGKIRVETLGESGRWFRDKFPQTPATAMVALKDWKREGRASVWYESRYYRVNLYWDRDGFRVRDIHLFNEQYPERYLKERVTTHACTYDALPVLDGFNWSTKEQMAGLRPVWWPQGRKSGPKPLRTGEPVVSEAGPDGLVITMPLDQGSRLEVRCEPARLTFAGTGAWELDMSWAAGKTVPITRTQSDAIHYRHQGFEYGLHCSRGLLTAADKAPAIMFVPVGGQLVLDMDGGATRAKDDKSADQAPASPSRADSPRAATPAEKPRVEEVIIVFKTHFDIGYTDMAAKVVERYRTSMIDQALEVVDQNRDLPAEQQFVWTIPGWPLHKMLEDWPGQKPERQQRIREAFKNGRFVVHALPFTTHTELLELEDLVRGLTYASQLSRAAGLPLPRDAKMTDVPSHTWALVTLLKHAGVDFLHLGCNAASSSPVVPPLFWWEGPDGSRLLTMYSAGGYGTELVPPKDWPYRAWLALIHTGDNHGPPRPEEVKKVLEEARQKLPGVKVKIGRLSDFADAVLANKPEIPVVRGDMPDTWIHGPMSDPHGAFQARLTRPKIAAAEALNTELRLWGANVPDASTEIAAAYEQSLLYGEHTWGGALAWLKADWGYGETWMHKRSEGTFKRSEDSWDEHSAYIKGVWDHAIPVLRAAHAELAKNVKVEGERVVVFNPLPWKQSAITLMQLPPEAKIKGLRPIDETTPVPSDGRGNVDRFLAKDVPAMGYRTYVPCDPAPNPPSGINTQAQTIESRFFKVRLDPQRGGVVSLIDKRSGRELVDANSEYCLGQYLYERFDRTQTEGFVKTYTKIDTEWARTEFGKPDLPPASEAPYRAMSPSGYKLSFREDPITIYGSLWAEPNENVRCKVILEVKLNRELPYVELSISLPGKLADTWPEAGWMCLPFKVDEPRFRLGRLGSIIDPAKDIVPGTNRHLLALNTGMTITDPQGQGVGLCPYSSWLVSLDTPGCWKYSNDFVPRKPVVFVNVFNNQWTTNFRLWNEGNINSCVRLWAVDSENIEAGLITPSLEKLHTFPLMGSYFDGPPGTLPPMQAGVELSRKGILVTAFGKNPDGQGLILRMWELAGNAGPCRVRLPAGVSVTSVQPVNLRGQPEGQPLAIQDGGFTVNIGAFAPVTVQLPGE